MNLQTFKAATMAEALTQVKSTMGTDAVILHTRTFQTRYWLGLGSREVVQITAGKGLNVGARARNGGGGGRSGGPAAAAALAARVVESRPAGGLAAYTRGTGGNGNAAARPGPSNA